MDAAGLLLRIIETHYNGNLSAFARAVPLPRVQIHLYVTRQRKPGRVNSTLIHEATKATGTPLPPDMWGDPIVRSEKGPHKRGSGKRRNGHG